ncbi:MAG: hypothetical protein WC765_08115, partial [Phycisphaerae bacterium]
MKISLLVMTRIVRVLCGITIFSTLICWAADPLDHLDQAAPSTLAKNLIIDKTENLINSRGILRLPRTYAQRQDGGVIIEAEAPTSFALENASAILNPFVQGDTLTSSGGYVTRLGLGRYDIAIERPAKLQLWYRALFPTLGNWNHSEQLDSNQRMPVSDNNAATAQDPSLNRWLWKKGSLYEFSKGPHSFSLDWQGGTKLDQLIFLPEGITPGEQELF